MSDEVAEALIRILASKGIAGTFTAEEIAELFDDQGSETCGRVVAIPKAS